MEYHIIYEPDYSRIYPAILIDCRADIFQIKNQVGSVMKSYIDIQLGQVGSNSIFYKIETDKGTIAGVFSVDVDTSNKTAVLSINRLRPAFKQFATEIQENIDNFISEKLWLRDFQF